MEVGMLWFDNDPRTALLARIARAADYYRSKYGVAPDLCLVHPSLLTGHPELIAGRAGKVSVRPNRTVLPGHFLIGTEDKK